MSRIRCITYTFINHISNLLNKECNYVGMWHFLLSGNVSSGPGFELTRFTKCVIIMFSLNTFFLTFQQTFSSQDKFIFQMYELSEKHMKSNGGPLWSLAVPYDPLRSPPLRSLVVPCDPMQSLAVPYSPLRYLVVPCGPLWSLVVPCGPLWYLAVPCGTLRYLAVPCSTLR